MSDIRWMDLNEFLNEGFLQEANRLFFHPLGLALAVTCDEAGKVTGITGLWDYRDDPEGMIFGEGVNVEKAQKVDAERHRHCDTRTRLFGTTTAVQPLNWRPDDGPPRDE